MKLRWAAAFGVVGVLGMAALLAGGGAERTNTGGWFAALAAQNGVASVDNTTYSSECGGCHFAYPPGLLPERSWRRLMNNLGDHFGENAEVSPDVQAVLTDYLVNNSAERDPGWIAGGILRTVASDTTPERITDIGYFVRQHDELPQRVWRDNPEVGSLGNCSACHSQAGTGSFDEHQVIIPGVGRWDD